MLYFASVHRDNNWSWHGAVFEHVRAQPTTSSQLVFEEIVTPIIQRLKPVVEVANRHYLWI
jgi:hypothetical protein